MSTDTWKSYLALSALLFATLGIYIWKRNRKHFVRVGTITKLYFYPVKSLKAVEVTHGRCTKFGFEFNGLLDRSFMLVNGEGVLVSQRQAPSLVHLTPNVDHNYIFISGPNTEILKVEIKETPSPDDKIINCNVHSDIVGGIDCGEDAASWFQSYLDMKDVRLVRFFPTCTLRKSTIKNSFYNKLTKNHPAGFQDLAHFHVLSQASIDDLNSRIGEKKISAINFRPNIVVDECEPYAEDSWKYIKLKSNAEMLNVALTTRCLMTTNDPETGILSQKEPLVTLRKYRIVEDPALLKTYGAIPCFGCGFAFQSPGDIRRDSDIFAVIDKIPKMKIKST